MPQDSPSPIPAESPAVYDRLEEIIRSTPPQTASPEVLELAAPSMNPSAAFFHTLLSTLTYEVRFTTLGRFYTAIPHAIHSSEHPLFSFRLLPHPEKLQSIALLNNNKLTEFEKSPPPPRSDSTIFGPLFWFILTSLGFLGILAWIMWRSRKKVTLRV